MAKHSKIGFSGARRWLRCPGSVRLSDGVAAAPSEYAEEGTAAHALAQHCLDNGYNASRLKGWGIDIDGERARFVEKPAASSLHLITDEMVTGVQLYLDAVRGDYLPGDDLEVEVKFSLPQLHPDLWGTADAVIYRESASLLRIYDFKYGAGVQVEVEENEQEIGYSLGAAFAKHNRKLRDIELVIVQPRAPHVDGPVRRWRTDATVLLDWAETYAVGAKATEAEDAPLVPGDHCRWCPAAGICPKLAEVAEIAPLDTFKGPKYDPEALSASLDRIKPLKGWIKSVEAFALAEANAGRCPPRWKLVDKRAERSFTDEEEARRALLGDGIDESLIIEPEHLKSPAQIEEAIGKPRFEELAGEYVTKISSGVTLAPESDKRPAKKRDIKKDFEPVSVAPSVVITATDPFA